MSSDLSYIGNYSKPLMYMLAKFNVNPIGIISRAIMCLQHQPDFYVTENHFHFNQILQCIFYCDNV